MFKYLAFAVITTVSSVAHADQTEIDADMQFYGQTIFEHQACGVEIIEAEPGVEKIYVGDDLVAVITIVDHRQAYLDSYQDGVQMETYTYEPFDELSVLSRDTRIDKLLDSYGVPPMNKLDAMACVTA